VQAKRYSHGVRLAKAYELDHELMNLALKSTPSVMINAAEYLDEKVQAHTHIHTHTHVWILTHNTQVHAYMNTHMHAYINTHTHKHTHIHTNTHALEWYIHLWQELHAHAHSLILEVTLHPLTLSGTLFVMVRVKKQPHYTCTLSHPRSHAAPTYSVRYAFCQGAHEKAATLYMKGGKLSKAVDMCFAAQLFDVLGQIADDLSSGGDPVLYMR